jgi:hypothetical protein
MGRAGRGPFQAPVWVPGRAPRPVACSVPPQSPPAPALRCRQFPSCSGSKLNATAAAQPFLYPLDLMPVCFRQVDHAVMPWAPSRGLALWPPGPRGYQLLMRGLFPAGHLALGCLGGAVTAGEARGGVFFSSRLQGGALGGTVPVWTVWVQLGPPHPSREGAVPFKIK